MYRVLAIITVLIFAAGSLSAQQTDAAAVKQTLDNAGSGIGVKPVGTLSSLLSSDRITWSHSYSVSFFSGGGTSSSLGMLNSTMNYRISNSLSLAVNLGVLHNTASLWGQGNTDATFLPGFRLDYRPSEKFFMSISYQEYAGGYYYSPSYWGRSSLFGD